jgi:dephospho-CoA kinase
MRLMKRPRDSQRNNGSSGNRQRPDRAGKRTQRRNRRQAPTRPIRVVGVVGGIGSGKSHVSALLAEKGATIIDADAVGHALLDQGPVQETLVRRFGPDILGEPDEDGVRKVDRRALGTIVFKDEASRKVLEEALHPRMRATFERVISRLSRQISPKPGSLRLPAPVVVLDAAVLYEAGWNDLCDLVVFVDAPKKDRLKRVTAGRGWSQEELESREAAQWPLELKKNQADLVVKNPDAESTAQLDRDIEKVWARLIPNPRPVVPKPATDANRFDHLIEDEIDVISTERPKRRKKSASRNSSQPRNRKD